MKHIRENVQILSSNSKLIVQNYNPMMFREAEICYYHGDSRFGKVTDWHRIKKQDGSIVENKQVIFVDPGSCDQELREVGRPAVDRYGKPTLQFNLRLQPLPSRLREREENGLGWVVQTPRRKKS